MGNCFAGLAFKSDAKEEESTYEIARPKVSKSDKN